MLFKLVNHLAGDQPPPLPTSCPAFVQFTFILKDMKDRENKISMNDTLDGIDGQKMPRWVYISIMVVMVCVATIVNSCIGTGEIIFVRIIFFTFLRSSASLYYILYIYLSHSLSE